MNGGYRYSPDSDFSNLCKNASKCFYFILKWVISFLIYYLNITHSNRLDLVAQLAEHWTSKTKGRGSIPISHRGQADFSACLEWIYTQSNTTIRVYIFYSLCSVQLLYLFFHK